MGQQQLLLVVLGAIIVGFAIIAGYSMLSNDAASSNRDEVSNDLLRYAGVAQSYYKRPKILGGGQRSFNGLRFSRINNKASNLNGTYTLNPDPVGGNPAYVTITGVGIETGDDGVEKVKVVLRVYPDSVRIDQSLGN
jgi:hypothetical protein